MTEEPARAPVHDRSLPFPVGHRFSVSHGAYSAELVGEDAAKVLHELAEFMPPWLMSVDQFQLTAWATAEGRCRRLRRYLLEHGDLDANGVPRPAADLLEKVEQRAARARERLGFDPLARARLAKDRAAAGLFTVQGQHIAGADRLVEDGRAIAQHRLGTGLPPAEPDVGEKPDAADAADGPDA